jgi:hypothetical protein
MASDLYTQQTVHKNVTIPVAMLHRVALPSYLERVLREECEERCIVEGFVKAGSIQVVKYTTPMLYADEAIVPVTFTCECCLPKEGDKFMCRAKEVTKAGVRAELNGMDKSPLVVFLSRDLDPYPLDAVQVGSHLFVCIMGVRFELYDKYISAIARVDASR